MKKLLGYADDYLKSLSLWDIGLLKVCLCALGVLIGVSVRPEKKKPVIIAGVLAFLASYIPLMSRFLTSVVNSASYEEDLEL